MAFVPNRPINFSNPEPTTSLSVQKPVDLTRKSTSAPEDRDPSFATSSRQAIDRKFGKTQSTTATPVSTRSFDGDGLALT
jgi:hypothetical protein